MGKDSDIEWTHHTQNLWWGCVKVGQGCKNCYAEDWMDAKQYWGARAPRRFFKDAHYRQPLAWDRAAERAGERHRVFCMSMGDLFERLHPAEPIRTNMRKWRMHLLNEVVPQTPNLDWLLLTKRLGNMLRMVPPQWYQEAWPRNVWLGFSASTQGEFDEGVRELINMRAALAQNPPVCFVSLEPLLELVNVLSSCLNCDGTGGVDSGGVDPQGHGIDVPCPDHTTFLDWVIIGGESGKDARPMHPDWARRVRDDCVAAGVPFFFKQWGAWLPAENYVEGWHNGVLPEGAIWMADGQGSATHVKVNKKLAGAILDGREWRQVPEVEHV